MRVSSPKILKVGMLGAGVVGSDVARLLSSNAEDLAARAGAELELVKIGVRNLNRTGVPTDLRSEEHTSELQSH